MSIKINTTRAAVEAANECGVGEFKLAAFLYTEGALDMLYVTAGADSSCLPELAFRLSSKFFSPSF